MPARKPAACSAMMATLRGPPGTCCRSWVQGYTLAGWVCSLPMMPVAYPPPPRRFGIDGMEAAVWKLCTECECPYWPWVWL